MQYLDILDERDDSLFVEELKMKSSAYQEVGKIREAMHDPLQEMLANIFNTQTATIQLDNASAIVQVLQERCQYDILHTVYQKLNTLMATRYAEQQH